MAKRRKIDEPAEPAEVAAAADPFSKLNGILANIKNDEKVAIFMHTSPGPDPDSLAAARALQWLLAKKYEISANIFGGEVSHTQNRTMVNVLGITLLPFDDYKEEEYVKRIIVDATCRNSFPDTAEIIIDHHRVVEEGTEFTHIEPVGAVSTLVWEYVQALGVPIEDDLDLAVTTGLFFGIRTDTHEWTAETTVDRDFSAFTSLLKDFVNKPKLADIINYPLPNYVFELEEVLTAEGNKEQHGSLLVATVGVISGGKRDSLPMLADKWVRKDGVETSVIFALIGDDIVASVRSLSPAFDVKAFCHRVFGKEFSGAKLGMGGAQVPVGLASLEDLPEDVAGELWSALKKKLFYKVRSVASNN